MTGSASAISSCCWTAPSRGFSANLLDKQYYNGNPNGNLQMPDERVMELFGEAHRSGISCSVHTNGNGATEQLLRVVEALQAEYPRADVSWLGALPGWPPRNSCGG